MKICVRIVTMLMMLMLLAGPAWAADYTITTSPAQEAALAYVVTAYNAKLLAGDPLAILVTQGAYLQRVVESVFANYERQKDEAEHAQAQALKAKYDALDPGKKQAVDNIMNAP